MTTDNCTLSCDYGLHQAQPQAGPKWRQACTPGAYYSFRQALLRNRFAS